MLTNRVGGFLPLIGLAVLIAQSLNVLMLVDITFKNVREYFNSSVNLSLFKRYFAEQVYRIYR